MNPLRTAAPSWVQITSNLSGLTPKEDCRYLVYSTYCHRAYNDRKTPGVRCVPACLPAVRKLPHAAEGEHTELCTRTDENTPNRNRRHVCTYTNASTAVSYAELVANQEPIHKNMREVKRDVLLLLLIPDQQLPAMPVRSSIESDDSSF